MKSTKVLYSCNVTLDPPNFDSQIERVSAVLDKNLEILEKTKITGVFYLDVSLLLQVKDTLPKTFLSIRDSLRKIDKKNHYLQLLMNPIWEGEQDLHRVDKERLVDIFAQNNHLLKEFYAPNNLERIHSIRIYSSKIQPFAYLQDIYQMLGIKIDASILPKVKKSKYFDYSNIKYGEITRFTNYPNTAERFGKYLGLSRAIFKHDPFLQNKINSYLKKQLALNSNYVVSYLVPEKNTAKLVSLPIQKENNLKIVSPDVAPLPMFQRIMDQQKATVKHICVLESRIDDLSQITEENLSWLQESSGYEIVSLKDIVEEFSTTYNVRFKR